MAAPSKRRPMKIRSGDHVKVIVGQGPRQERAACCASTRKRSASTSRA